MRFFTLTSLLAITHYVAAQGVTLSITSPDPPAAGTVTITFADAGGTPDLAALSAGSVQLYVGGNTDGTNAMPLLTLGTITYPALTMTATISAGIAESITDGFYLKVTSTVTDGGTVINYSPRFSISGLTGTTSATYVSAASAAGTTVPTAVVSIAAAAATVATAGAEGVYATPYNEQTGLTKYAPMQPIPPTKITATATSPLYPTSAFSTATTWLAPATIVTTITEAQTFSVSSIENTAAAQSLPTGDVAKFLARWKD